MAKKHKEKKEEKKVVLVATNFELTEQGAHLRIALDILFEAPFKNFDLVDRIIELRDRVIAARVDYDARRNALIKAHGKKSEHGQYFVSPENKKSFIVYQVESMKLRKKTVVIELEPLKLTRNDLAEAKISLSAAQRTALRGWVEIEE